MYIETLLNESAYICKCRADWCMHNKAFFIFFLTCRAAYCKGKKKSRHHVKYMLVIVNTVEYSG